MARIVVVSSFSWLHQKLNKNGQFTGKEDGWRDLAFLDLPPQWLPQIKLGLAESTSRKKLPLGIPHGWPGRKHLRHLLQLLQTHEQRAGLELDQLGLDLGTVT